MDARTALGKRENFQELLDTVKENFKEMRERIKKKTFDLDNQDENGKTVLINVVEMRTYTEQMWVLLDYGADPNVQDNEGKTALHYAVAVDRKDMIICLLLFGADTEIKDKEDKKPFDDLKDDSNAILNFKEKTLEDIKREFINLTRKRRKFLKYIFDEIDKETSSKYLNAFTLGAYYEKINKESNEEAMKDAQSFVIGAKIIKSTYEDSGSGNITFEEFIVAICRIVKAHGIKVIDDFINRFKKIRVKFVPKEGGDEEEGKDENKE